MNRLFAGPNAPTMDFVITVCDNAAGEACPVWRRIALLLALPLDKLDNLARTHELQEIALHGEEHLA